MPHSTLAWTRTALWPGPAQQPGSTACSLSTTLRLSLLQQHAPAHSAQHLSTSLHRRQAPHPRQRHLSRSSHTTITQQAHMQAHLPAHIAGSRAVLYPLVAPMGKLSGT
jgi:hypothetical protein